MRDGLTNLAPLLPRGACGAGTSAAGPFWPTRWALERPSRRCAAPLVPTFSNPFLPFFLERISFAGDRPISRLARSTPRLLALKLSRTGGADGVALWLGQTTGALLGGGPAVDHPKLASRGLPPLASAFHGNPFSKISMCGRSWKAASARNLSVFTCQ